MAFSEPSKLQPLRLWALEKAFLSTKLHLAALSLRPIQHDPFNEAMQTDLIGLCFDTGALPSLARLGAPASLLNGNGFESSSQHHCYSTYTARVGGVSPESVRIFVDSRTFACFRRGFA